MAGDWLKFQKATLDKPEVFEIAESLHLDCDSVIGKLLRVWSWFDEHTEDGNAPVTLRALLDRYAGVTGFVAAMERVGWMEEIDGRLILPRFERHNGKTAKARALGKNRANSHRGKSNAESNAASVTKALPEKRREETIETLSRAREAVRDLPTWEQVAQAAANMMIPANIAERFYDDMEACGWVDAKSRPIQNFQPALKAWANRYQDNEARKQHSGGPRANGHRVDRNAGNSNAGRAGEYRDV